MEEPKFRVSVAHAVAPFNKMHPLAAPVLLQRVMEQWWRVEGGGDQNRRGSKRAGKWVYNRRSNCRYTAATHSREVDF